MTRTRKEGLTTGEGIAIGAGAIALAGTVGTVLAKDSLRERVFGWFKRDKPASGGPVGGSPAAPTPPADAGPPAGPPTPAPPAASSPNPTALEAAEAAARGDVLTEAEMRVFGKWVLGGGAGVGAFFHPDGRLNTEQRFAPNLSIGAHLQRLLANPARRDWLSQRRMDGEGLGIGPLGGPLPRLVASIFSPAAPAVAQPGGGTASTTQPPGGSGSGRRDQVREILDLISRPPGWGTIPGTRIPIPTDQEVIQPIGSVVGRVIIESPSAAVRGTGALIGLGVGAVDEATGASAAERQEHKDDLSFALDEIIASRDNSKNAPPSDTLGDDIRDWWRRLTRRDAGLPGDDARYG